MEDEDKLEVEKLENRLHGIEMVLGCLIGNDKKQEEMLETILHAVCKGNDQKTIDSIRKYLLSDFRNNRGMY